jgi:hypothetical protein
LEPPHGRTDEQPDDGEDPERDRPAEGPPHRTTDRRFATKRTKALTGRR